MPTPSGWMNTARGSQPLESEWKKRTQPVGLVELGSVVKHPLQGAERFFVVRVPGVVHPGLC